MSNPENTTQREPMIHLLGSMSDGSSGYIEGLEAAGQRQLVASTSLPADMRPGEDEYAALGFAFRPADKSDPLFRPATLPQGWRKQPSDHSMWSYVVDELGRRRVAVFYKAAFYDRRAFMRFESLLSYAGRLVQEGGEPIFDETWCTREAFAAELARVREDSAKYADNPAKELAAVDHLLALTKDGE